MQKFTVIIEEVVTYEYIIEAADEDAAGEVALELLIDDENPPLLAVEERSVYSTEAVVTNAPAANAKTEGA